MLSRISGQHLRRYAPALFMSGMLFMAGCSKKAAPPPPTTKQPNQGVNANGASASGGDKPAEAGGSESSGLKIKLSGKSGTTVSGKEGSSLNVKFEITGVSDADDVQIALLEAPSSVKLTGRDSLKPIITWSSPKSGNHKVRFVLRDMKACTGKESPADCELGTKDDRNVKTGTYDTKSETFTLDIDRKSSSLGGDGGDGGAGDGGGNGDLIQKIIGIAGGLLGGGGGGLGGLGGLLGGGGGGLQNILGGLGGGQLNGLLGQLQGGGGLGGFNDMLNQFTGGANGGFPLTGDPAADLEGIIRNYEETVGFGEDEFLDESDIERTYID